MSASLIYKREGERERNREGERGCVSELVSERKRERRMRK